MGKKNIKKQLEIFKSRIRGEFSSAKIILYGSYAKNLANSYSDVDLIVLSDDFFGMNEDDRFRKLYNISEDLHPDFQAHGLTFEEVVTIDKESTLKEAIEEGIVI